MNIEKRHRLVGVVVSDKMAKTIVVRVDRTIRHPLYQKVLRRGKNFTAHDETNSAHEGDMVRIVESRPLSATKRWKLEEIIRKAGAQA
ncbi:MAG TPA: 30S ribosomal protein S17 [Anaerolineae bacterium]|jgi:small subunit ribosomal protein S17